MCPLFLCVSSAFASKKCPQSHFSRECLHACVRLRYPLLVRQKNLTQRSLWVAISSDEFYLTDAYVTARMRTRWVHQGNTHRVWCTRAGNGTPALDTVALRRIVVRVTTVKLLQVSVFPWHCQKDLAILHKADQGVHNWLCTNIVGPWTHHRHICRIHDGHMETDTTHE